MIRKLSLTNFRRHTDLTLEFTPGLVALRAANERGKSTICESILYALFGSSLLRTSLDDAVTWGQKPSSLRVELDIEIQGRAYSFTRSASGAEVTFDGKVFVTGQKEVSAFAAQLLGADGKAVQRLLFANQNAIRGALEDGPKAVATQIETLCDFDIFDQIIERMQEKLVIGSPAICEARLREAEDKAACFVAPVEPDIARMTMEAGILGADVIVLKEGLEVAEKASANAYSAWQNAENAQRMHTTLATNLRKQEEDLKLHEAQLQNAEAKVRAAPFQADIDALKTRLQDAQEHVRKVKANEAFNLLRYPDVFWEGSKESLNAGIRKMQEDSMQGVLAEQAAKTSIYGRLASVEMLRSKVVSSLICTTCKQAIKNADEVRESNKRIEAEIAAEEAAIEADRKYLKALQDQDAVLQGHIRGLMQTLKSSEPFDRFATAYGAYVDVDLDFVPPRITWRGLPPSHDGLDEKEIKSRLLALEQSQDEARRASGKADLLRQAILDDRAAIQRARDQLAQYPEVANVDDLKRDYGNKYAACSTLKSEILEKQARINDIEAKAKTAQAEYDAAVSRGNELKDAVKQAQNDLESLGFNNALLKKVRAIRPLVADKLWNQVLAAVGTMFSQIRGERSVVTKDKSGFQVNGACVESLSGSTLDALGLAIRVALAKTFLPHVTFMALDEPTHGCDPDRATSFFGFLASAGFDQCIVVTHNEIADSIADNLITL